MMGLEHGFSGSYAPEDVTFLLKPVTMGVVDVATKEAAIQSGLRHYSEMLAPEPAPSAGYLAAFHQAHAANRARVGSDLARLVQALARRGGAEIVLVSLARAGTPVGILLRRGLAALGHATLHYSVSIIRGRGLDLVAMRAILAAHAAEDVVFVDGWTGKGAIGAELARALRHDLPELRGAPLCVLSDLAGVADLAAGAEDYLIPSAILNGVVSGLVSRSVLSPAVVGPGEFHACVRLTHLAGHDLSRRYVDEQTADLLPRLAAAPPACWTPEARAEAAAVSARFLDQMLTRSKAGDRNRIKPGIGEATRALLRRMPDRLFVRDPADHAVRHLLALAAERSVAVEVDPALSYGACAIIKTLGEA